MFSPKSMSNLGRLTVLGMGEGIGLCGKHIQELYTVYLNRFRNLYKIALPPQGASDRQKPSARSLYRSIFKKNQHLGVGVFLAIWSMYYI